MSTKHRRSPSRLSSRKCHRLRAEKLEQRQLLAGDIVISEFVASNDDSLLDDNLRSTDWIEIYNSGSTAVDLLNYTLTDDPNDVTKWAFPSVVLQPKGYLVVFAGIDIAPSTGTDLYTGFSLDSSGEFLGLYDPARAPLSSFEDLSGAAFPPQSEDVAYGPRPFETLTTVLATGDDSDYLVPNNVTGPALGNDWYQRDYVLDSLGETWQSGPSGFGYDQGTGYDSLINTDVGPSLYNQGTSLYIRSNFDQSPTDPIEVLRLRAQYEDGFVAFLNGREVLRSNGPLATEQSTTTIPLGNLFDDPKTASLSDAILSDTYVASADTSDLGVYTVITGGLNVGQIIAPGVTFDLSNAGGGSAQAGGPSNDTFRANDVRPISTTNTPVLTENKIEDGIGMHANALLTFDLNEIRQANETSASDGYFTSRIGLNDTAGTNGSIKAIAILSDASGQVLNGYINGRKVSVSQSGGTWSFSGPQPGVLNGSGNGRFANLAFPVPSNAAFLTLAGVSSGAASSDHVVFSNANLELDSIALGNLFDDPNTATLTNAQQSDSQNSIASVDDLGVEVVIDGGFQSLQTIAPQTAFDFSNLGTSNSGNGLRAANDSVNSTNSQPIGTRDIGQSGSLGATFEDGIGLPADGAVTFNLQELRNAGSIPSASQFRFRARAAINDSAPNNSSGLAVAIATDTTGDVSGAWVNGQNHPVIFNNNAWSIDLAAAPPAEITKAGGAAEFDIDLGLDAAYLTIVSGGGASTDASDQIVFSGARLSVVRDIDGVSYNSAAGASRSDSLAVVPIEFDLSQYAGLIENGTNVLAIQALNVSAGSSDFLFSHEIIAGGLDFQNADNRFFVEPTPGAPNGPSVRGIAADTKFNVDRGFYTEPFDLEITSATPGAQIYFTTDASLPGPENPNATLYAGPIPIGGTTNVRAIAFADDYAPSDVDTQTYIFLNDILDQDPRNQNGGGISPDNGLTYPATWEGNTTGDYAIDPTIVMQYDDANPQNSDFGIRESLLSLPTVSLTLQHDDAFAALSAQFPGIVTDARNRGEGFRHDASVEYFDPATGQQFQANASVQAQGNSSRSNGSTRKHSYRLIFNGALGGPDKLNFPLFDNSDFADINTFTLKAASTDGFTHRTVPGAFNAIDSTLTREAFVRQLQFDTGNLSPDSTFAHVYINGLYWGIYTPIERPDDAFFSSRFGGEREDWDIFRDANELLSGERGALNEMQSLIASISTASAANANDLFQELQGNSSDGSNDPNREALMNIDNFIDYYLIHTMVSANDWPVRNWYAGRNRLNPGKGFQFFAWDQGQSLAQNFTDQTERNGGLGTLFKNLRNSSDFRLRVADRIQQHAFNDGALTLSKMQQQWASINSNVEPAIVAETARWGDAREGLESTPYPNQVAGAPAHPSIPYGQSVTVPTLTIDDWRSSVAYVQNDVLPFAQSLFFQRLGDDNLLASVETPSFLIAGHPQHGGSVLTGSALTISGPQTVYFTIDGTDPRAVGGGIAGNAFTSALSINSTTVVKARSLSGGQWSAISEATFVTANELLTISEINFNPHDPSPSELAQDPTYDNDDFEFIELLNTSATETINLQGIQLAEAVSYTFENSSLGPGERTVVVENLAAFEARYGTGINVAGKWSGGLNNGGEAIELLDSMNTVILDVDYGDSDPWGFAADGDGATLVLTDAAETPVGELNKPYHWTTNTEFGGTPGTEGTAPSGVVINEVLAHTDFPQVDGIELLNTSDVPVDISGWWISDSGSVLQKFQIPTLAALQPGGTIAFDETDFNPLPETPLPNHFALSGSTGDQVYLTQSANGSTTRFEDAVEFGATLNGQSLGRSPGRGRRLAPLTQASLGMVNGAFDFSDVVLSEVHYHPADPTAAALAIAPLITAGDLEFIELLNAQSSAIDLTNWRLRGESDFDFSTGQMIPAGETLVVVSFDPDSDTAIRDAFLANYSISSSVSLVGPFDGKLSNSHGVVKLQRPDAPPAESPSAMPSVLSDEVFYDDLSPWATTADGNGNSLQRTSPSTLGSFSASWEGTSPTPGSFVTAHPILINPFDFTGGPGGHSVIRELEFSFDRIVTVDPDAVSLIRRESGPLAPVGINFTTQISGGQTQVRVTFTNADANRLSDGFYQLNLDGSLIVDGSGQAFDGDGNGVPGGTFQYGALEADRFFAFYGDTDGDLDVDGQDYGRFGLTFLRSQGDAGFNPALDSDGDGDVDGQDYGRFGLNFLQSIEF